MKYQISHFILKKSHNFSKSFNFRLYILHICKETYKKYFNISRNLINDKNESYLYKKRRLFITKFIFKKNENYGMLGRYGILRLHFIAQNKQALYETLLMTNKLTHHLLLLSRSCENYYKELMENYIKNDERLPKKNKELNPLEWTKLMNTYKNTAEEIVLNEYVFI